MKLRQVYIYLGRKIYFAGILNHWFMFIFVDSGETIYFEKDEIQLLREL